MFLPLKPTQEQIKAVGQAMISSGYINLEQILADEKAQWVYITIPNCPVVIRQKVIKDRFYQPKLF